MGSNTIILGLVFLGVVGAFIIVAALMSRKSGSRSLAMFGKEREKPEDQEGPRTLAIKGSTPDLRMAFVERVLRPMSRMMQLSEGSRSQVQEMLVHAGMRKKGAVEIFLGAKIAMALALPAAVGAVLAWRASVGGGEMNYQHLLMFCCGGLVMGLMLPNMWLRRKAKGRMDRIRLELPDALDLLVVCIESGMGLDAALIRIGKEMETTAPDLSEELTLLTLEMSAGKEREVCLRNFGLRTGCEDVKSLAARINQSAKFGTNLAHSLRIHSESLRQKRRQQAEEQAAKTTIKLLFPLIFFIFPTIFVVILGPAAVKVASSMF